MTETVEIDYLTYPQRGKLSRGYCPYCFPLEKLDNKKYCPKCNGNFNENEKPVHRYGSRPCECKSLM